MTALTDSKTTEGWIYLLGNPNLPGWIKVGKTSNPSRRLNQYQTADPERSYRFFQLIPTRDRHTAEFALLRELDRRGYLPHHEWFEVSLEEASRAVEWIMKEFP